MYSSSGSDGVGLSEQQARIHRRLALIGPGAAAFYHDACHLLHDGDRFLTASHLVAHLLREVESALRAVLVRRQAADKPSPSTSSAPAEHRAKALAFLSDVGIPETDPVAESLLARMSGEGNHRMQVRAILADLGIPETDPVATRWVDLATGSRLSTRAHRAALGAPRPFDDEFRRYVGDVETVLDGVLERFELRYADLFAILDEMAARPRPAPGDVDALKNHLPNNLVALEHFFSRVEGPEWIAPLRRKGFFKHPLGTEQLSRDDGGVTRYFAWPPSRFLVKVAHGQGDPAAVLQAALDIPPTDNPFLQEDLIRVSLALPPELAVQLVPTIKQCLALSNEDTVADAAGRLVAYLARGGQASSALDLARELLVLQPSAPIVVPASDDHKEIGFTPDPQSRYGHWTYQDVLDALLPGLVSAAGLDAIQMLCDLLQSAVIIGLDLALTAPPLDWSTVWRRAIESDPEDGLGDERDALVSAIRSAAERFIDQDASARLPQVLELLASYPWAIFQRLDLYLLSQYGAAAPNLARARLTNRDLFDRWDVRHEYDRLKREWFGHLNADDQATALRWIDGGPDVEAFRDLWRQRTHEEVTEADVGAYVGRWQRDHLEPIRDELQADWRARFDVLVATYGTLEDTGEPGPDAWIPGSADPTSIDDLEAMDLDELSTYLKAWASPDTPPPGGLAHAPTALSTADPERYTQTVRFAGLDPILVTRLLEGLREALKTRPAFPWASVLDFCQAVVAQPHLVAGRDSALSAARIQVARLLIEGFRSRHSPIPIGLRDQVWSVLQPLTEDPDPTLEDDERYVGRDASPVKLVTTAVRRAAIVAVVDYARWVWIAHLLPEGGLDAPWSGLDSVSEARAVLIARLDPSVDRALTVRAVYGALLQWLVLLDSAWTKSF